MPLTRIAEKFNAYFRFTRDLTRCIPQAGGWFQYPHDSMISDLTALWAFFSDTYDALGNYNGAAKKHDGVDAYLNAHPAFKDHFTPIVSDAHKGEFWSSNTGTLTRVPFANIHFGHVARTLRNGFAHFHWRYEDLDAQEYWVKQGWDVTGAPAAFGLATRPKDNGRLYIPDGLIWDASKFWKMNDLRIVVTDAGTLRYHLHLFLNNALNNANIDVFGNQK